MNRTDGNSWIIITDGYINSWSFVQILRSLECPGTLVVLRRPGRDASIMDLYGDDVQTWTLDFSEPGGLLPFLKQRIPEEDPKALFFTDESLLPAVHRGSSDAWMANARVYPGGKCDLEIILDRPAFYEFIERLGLAEVPRTIGSESDPFRTFPEGFFLRFRRSWDGLARLPRPRLVESQASFKREVESLTGAGWTAAQWCYQEKLSIDPKDNVSICGWHDARDPSYLATRKAFQYPAQQGGGAIVEVVQVPAVLTDTTRGLLEALNYEGPFELEFVLDGNSGRYKIIELNPRLWMQHALHGAHTGQTIARRYLGLEAAPDAVIAPPLYWINGVVAANRVLGGSQEIWRYLRCPRRILAPDWRTTFRWLPRFLPNLVRRNLSGWRR
ncbi:MAG: hypothetical protein H7A46_18290 [Verrucomicrobiales bacterium]|nr:hypothetical protein [Planctomycetota bacterium]MCP5523491.1 hypothetical protein [Verrucomicrobiales bacterium]